MTAPRHRWKVAPLSKGQLLDVNPDDILEGGLYRKCSTLKGGGGYDRFPGICQTIYGIRPTVQFIVQLYGCHLDCPYCYATREGVWSKFEGVTTKSLVRSYRKSGLKVFHLMGGAPGLQLKHWPELLQELNLGNDEVFHSDLMLTENWYDEEMLNIVAEHRAIIAVNIKGLHDSDWELNTRKPANWDLFHENIELLMKIENLNFYFTFTNINKALASEFMTKLNDYYFGSPTQSRVSRFSYHIKLINYKAVEFVDDHPWGGPRKK